jgi:hypothetical protein
VALVRTDVSEELSASIIRVTRIGELGTIAVTSNRSTLMMEALSSFESSDLTRATRRNIPEDAILHSHRRENLKSYIALTGGTLQRRRNLSHVRYELGFYIPEDGILHSHCRDNLKSYLFELLFYKVNSEENTRETSK